MTAKDFAALISLGALWGASFLFIRVAVPVLGPFVLVGVRVGLAALVLALFAVAARRALKLRGLWAPLLFVGIANTAVPFALISASEVHLTASLAAILNSTTVLFTALVAAVWLGESLTPKKIGGVLLGIFGVAVLVGWDPLPLTPVVLLSVAAVLGASLCYGVGGVFTKRTFAGVPPLTLAVGQQTAAAAVMLPVAVIDLPVGRPSVAAALCVLALAVLSTAVAYLLFFYLIASAGPTATSTVTLIVPVFGLIFGVLFLDEPVGPGTIAGLAVILCSVVLITGIGFGRAEKVPAR
ncbi:MAG: Permease of the drug/metabolite transporter (DMT) superfamily [uncultured Rubrobacteraceae bacterium]|uniref:Permease of the drug/metabolite transporter (DMT) superfamily n=1 Tax=uncultured Rubrobacteraceae bacterium TaxID=349277 RepID=A0A6J4R0C7_9ACTN|nr:MAG: Permease of the drug/metabolite transporter (DMT) superfamily [uncultured Rubrobacteraceae bacterium]